MNKGCHSDGHVLRQVLEMLSPPKDCHTFTFDMSDFDTHIVGKYLY